MPWSLSIDSLFDYHYNQKFITLLVCSAKQIAETMSIKQSKRKLVGKDLLFSNVLHSVESKMLH